MNQKVKKTLEYHKIINRLLDFSGSTIGQDQIRSLEPSIDTSEIRKSLTETDDALSRLLRGCRISFSGVKDIRASLKRLEIGSTLNAKELLEIASLLESAKIASQANRTARDEEITDSLSSYFDGLSPLTPLHQDISFCILSEDEISDDASPTLKSIRRNMKRTEEKIHSSLSSMLGNTTIRSYLQETVITMRNGRYCLPVRSDAKSQVPGMVHDQSASGSTLFIEPMSVVQLNNELKELSLQENEEIQAILATLSEKVSEHTEELSQNLTLLTQLDVIFAKANYAKELNATKPMLREDGIVHLKKARHPLLDKKKVVPIDLRLGEEFDLLIVTGPNTGGKTVSLKTLGLLIMMAQSGLLIPVADGSEISIFHEIYADIGDEQSIEQSLSTFSSHMTNLISILNKADQKSLCLFDELCAGTDPTEGAALAISILSSLHQRQIRTMATTHYSELKVYALSTEGVENASCEFDVQTLSPTYRLLIGVPGKSNAFAISQKLGLPVSYIEDAKSRLSEASESFEDVIADLEHTRSQLEKEQIQIENYKREIEHLKTQLENKQEHLEQRKDKIINEAKEEAAQILRDAKEVADTSIRNFHKYGSTAPIQELEAERTKLRNKIKDNEKKNTKKNTKETPHKVPKNLRIGDSVKVISMNLKGTVHTLPNAKGDLYVQMGILRSLVNINDLILIEDAPVTNTKQFNRTNAGKLKMNKAANVSTEINLIGKNSDDAIAMLDKYLDDAYLAHLASVRIVHGKGTGTLRKAVQSHLKTLPYIKSFQQAEYGEGDAGVTIAVFK